MTPRADHQNPYTRYKPKREFTPTIKVPGHWAAWVRTFKNQIVRLLIREEAIGEGPAILLYFPATRAGRASLAINLSELTEKELDAIQVFLNDTFDLARPICRLRDGNAYERAQQGDDSDSRVYRIFPEVVNRPWASGIDAASVLDRLAHVSNGHATGELADPILGGDESGMAEYDAIDIFSQDYNTPIDLNEGVREVGWTGDTQ